MKKAYIKTYGCQMNEQDSAQMLGLLARVGFQKTTDVHEADLILLNTCSIREKAVHKIYSELGRIRPLKDDNPKLIVGIAGCVAEQEKENLSQRFPFLDLVFGPDHIRKLPKMIADVINKHTERPSLRPATRDYGEAKRTTNDKRRTLVQTGFDRRQDFKFVNILPNAEETPVKAFVNIQKGCDNICSFCIVPFVRGREVSRPHQEVLDEIQSLVERGVKEVTLLGQNVNSYGFKRAGGVSFARLLALVAKQTDLKRLRFTTSHPKDVGDDLIDEFANNPILVPQFHLPVQSGSNRILKLMKRQYTKERFLKIVDDLQERVPAIRFSSDIIVGFPTETEEEFQETLQLMERVRFDFTFSFIYSSRPYTRAAEMKDDIPQKEKAERLQRLQQLDKKMTSEKNQAEVDCVHDVLVESIEDQGFEFPNKGRTATNKVVHFKGDCQLGEFVPVKIIQANPHSLYGQKRNNELFQMIA